MNEKLDDIDKIVQYWRDSSDQDFRTMQNLFLSKDFSWALFIGHLVLEKLLKAHFVKDNQKHALFTHDLLRLADLCNFTIDETYKDWLDQITSFNLNARYDSYKSEFYKLCTEEYSLHWKERIEILRLWLIQKF
ncbi:MAG: toxin-antitoxin system antidote component [Algoriphagus marincola HL-49]|uniref:Toxin-antitoxin system antidote component n=1 Tax=Algoriphagus marincola HL-49 TaxID=1305737 RepID=A0A0P8BW59_9BACT|nr:MAG: toxin-antitoxin system antidote component [Algoriphagus marincola HL-49]